MLGVFGLNLGCSIVTRGSDYCYRFLDYICAQDFDKAYEMLADSIKAPETEEEREDRVAAEEKEKEENRKIWRQVFGLDKLESPSPEAEEATPSAEAASTRSPNSPRRRSWSKTALPPTPKRANIRRRKHPHTGSGRDTRPE